MANEDTKETTTTQTPPSQGTETAPAASAEHLSSLIDRAPAPTDDKPAVEATPVPAGDSTTQDGKPAAAAAPKKYKVRGQELTEQEIIERGLLDALVTAHEQLPHFQKKYEETKAELDKAAQPKPDATTPQPPPLSQQQIRMAYAEEIPLVVQAGYVERDFAELYPDAVAQMLFHRDLLYDLRTAFLQLRGSVGGRTQKADAAGHKARIDQAIESLADQGEIYVPLKEPDMRAKFWDYLRELDPLVSSLTPEFLQRQWVAYNHEVVLAATRAAGERTQREAEASRRRAAGDGRGSRPSGPREEVRSHLDTLVDGALPRR